MTYPGDKSTFHRQVLHPQGSGTSDNGSANLRKKSVDPPPVDHLEKGFDIVGPSVLLLQIIDMLPQIQSKNRLLAFGQGAVLVGGGHDLKRAAVPHQPGPPAAEKQGGRRGKVALEAPEITPTILDGGGNTALRWDILFEEGPEKRMIGMAPSMIANGRSDVFRHGSEVFQQLFSRALFQFAMALEGGIELVDVGLVVFGMVDYHGAGIDVRFQGIVGVVEFG